MNCHICQAHSEILGKAIVLGKYEVTYFRCPSCGFIQSEKPHWLEEAYSSAITSSDTGLVKRNMVAALRTKALVYSVFNRDGKFIDFGGGYGLFVRMMRDENLDFYRYDKYCENLFAGGMDVEIPSSPSYELLTAFEVIEHFEHPLEGIAELLRFSDNLLVSTCLVPNPVPKPQDWWYFGLEHGQHISLYTLESLSRLASHFGLNLYSDGAGLHLLTRRRLPPPLFSLLTHYYVAYALSPVLRKRPLNPSVASMS